MLNALLRYVIQFIDIRVYTINYLVYQFIDEAMQTKLVTYLLGHLVNLYVDTHMTCHSQRNFAAIPISRQHI